MSGLKSLILGLLFVCLSFVVLSITITPANSAVIPQVGLDGGEKPSARMADNGPVSITQYYFPLINRNDLAACVEITTDTTWSLEGSPYHISCDVYVASGATLTINAGVTVLFEHIGDDLIISGRLQAVGNEQAPIIFQPLSGTDRGLWGSVAFWPGSSGLLDYVILVCGGSSKGMVYISSDAVQVLNSVVQDSLKSGIYIQAASPVISNTHIEYNRGDFGGGLINDFGSPIIQNNTFTGNYASQGGGLYNGSGAPAIQNNTFVQNSASFGGGLFNISGSPTIQGNRFFTNLAYGNGGGLYISSGNPIIQDNTFIGNYLPFEGYGNVYGCGLYNGSGSPLIQNNTFTRNSVNCFLKKSRDEGLYNDTASPILSSPLPPPPYSISIGGGMYNDTGSPTIQNNIFNDNSVCWGGGLANGPGSPLIQNNTFTSNNGDFGGGGLLIDGSPIVRNNIIVSNTVVGLPDEIDVSGTPTMDFNDVWNNTGGNYSGITPGPHDISADPLWVDPANGDYHLTPDSPCIDTGNPNNFPATDIDGDPRPLGLAPDIGVDEYQGMRLVITDLVEETSPGKPVTYRMTLVSLTAISLTNVLLTDTLPVETAYMGYQADDLTCTHDGSSWGGQLRCNLDSLSLTPGESRILTVTVMLSQNLALYQYVTNHVLATASGGGGTFIAEDQVSTWVTLCAVQLNGTPMGNDLQAAISASTQATDVIQVTDYCHMHDLRLNKTLTLQGGWSHDFSEWDPAVYTTTLDGQNLGRVIWVDGVVTPTIEGFIITGGFTTYSDGGIFISFGSPTIQNNTFTDNTALLGGGGLYNGSGSPTIQNNIFSSNAGNGLSNGSGSPTIQHNIFSSNAGHGLYNNSGNPTIQNNIFSSNVGHGLYNDSGNPTIQNNTFSSNPGGGLFNYVGSPLIQNNNFIGNGSVTDGGGLYNGGGDPVIQYNTFSGNTALSFGGGLFETGTSLIQNNIFFANSAESGGGLCIFEGTSIVQNNIFVNNTAEYAGGGLFNPYGSPTIQNNTFIDNSAVIGSGLYNETGSPIIRSNIIVKNTASNSGGGIYNSSGAPTLDYNDVWDNTGGDYYNVTPGTHDISADPLLVDPANGDFHLTPGSLCIDAGDPVNYPPTDFEGDLRPYGWAPDIGADEFHP